VRERIRGAIAVLKKYKNGFLDIIRKHGLDPLSFNASERTQGAQSIFTVQFMTTGLRFEASPLPGNLHLFTVRYSCFNVGFPLRAYEVPICHDDNVTHVTHELRISHVHSAFDSWLREHIKPYIDEMVQPDLWTQIEQQKQLISADPLTDYETSSFTEAEKQQVRASIGQFRVLICESFPPTQDQLEVIDQRLDYLMAAVDRPINRLDWKSIALSTVVSIFITLSLDTNRGRQLFELFKQAFGGALHLLGGS
jgi:hypothetical protein